MFIKLRKRWRLQSDWHNSFEIWKRIDLTTSKVKEISILNPPPDKNKIIVILDAEFKKTNFGIVPGFEYFQCILFTEIIYFSSFLELELHIRRYLRLKKNTTNIQSCKYEALTLKGTAFHDRINCNIPVSHQEFVASCNSTWYR